MKYFRKNLRNHSASLVWSLNVLNVGEEAHWEHQWGNWIFAIIAHICYGCPQCAANSNSNYSYYL
jgi:hypothetical protein